MVFDSGCNYWSFHVQGKTSGSNEIAIGVGSATGYPHDDKDHSGCSLSLLPGISPGGQYHHFPFDTRVQKATTIGVLLDMDHKMVTFYADGKRIGIGAGADVLTGAKYYPLVSLSEIGHCVGSSR
jgi:hypothetical protein